MGGGGWQEEGYDTEEDRNTGDKEQLCAEGW